MSSRAALEVLVVDDERALADAIVVALRSRGHDVSVAYSGEDALLLPTPDVLVCDLELGGISGIELCEALRRRGSSARTIFVSGMPTLDACRRALQLGAAEFFPKPFSIDELIESVEAPGHGRADAERADTFERSGQAGLDAIELCVRDLLAFLVRGGVSPSTRARVAGACAEVLDNVRLHAYDDGPLGAFRLCATLGERELLVEIDDDGIGFDAVEISVARLGEPIHSGLARAASLCEDVRFECAEGGGAYVALRFGTFRARFDEEGLVDLSELDYLTPGMAKRLLEMLADEDDEPMFHLSPALAVSVGRMLTGPTERRSATTALWS